MNKVFLVSFNPRRGRRESLRIVGESVEQVTKSLASYKNATHISVRELFSV